MFRLILFFPLVLLDVIAHPLFSDLDYSSFSWLPDEALSFFTSPDNSGDPDLYTFDLSDYNSQNDWEVSCITSDFAVFASF